MVESKKILMVSPYFVPEGHGLENYVFQIGKRLVKMGYEIVVVCGTRGDSGEENIEGMKVIRLKANWIISVTPIRINLAIDLWNVLKGEVFDLIHAHTPVPFFADTAAMVAHIKKLPFIVTYHASSLKKGIWWIDQIAHVYLFFQRFTLGQAKEIVAVSGNMLGGILKPWKKKTRVITPGVDPRLFPFRSREGRKRRSILFVGNLSKATRWKGLSILMKALPLLQAQYPDLRCWVAGGGDAIEEYRDQVKQLGLGNVVEFLGKIDYAKLALYYQKTEVVVIPTTSDVEGCPTVMFEAMSSGAPVIGSNIAGIPHVIQHEQNGLLFSPSNVHALVHAIDRLFTNPLLWSKCSQEGRIRVDQNYTWDVITMQYHNLYQAL